MLVWQYPWNVSNWPAAKEGTHDSLKSEVNSLEIASSIAIVSF